MRVLREKDSEVREAIQKMEKQQDLDIDDAVVTTTPLYRQYALCSPVSCIEEKVAFIFIVVVLIFFTVFFEKERVTHTFYCRS